MEARVRAGDVRAAALGAAPGHQRLLRLPRAAVSGGEQGVVSHERWNAERGRQRTQGPSRGGDETRCGLIPGSGIPGEIEYHLRLVITQLLHNASRFVCVLSFCEALTDLARSRFQTSYLTRVEQPEAAGQYRSSICVSGLLPPPGQLLLAFS